MSIAGRTKSRMSSTNPAATRTRASPRRNARRAAPSRCNPAARRAAAPSTARRSRCSRSPMSRTGTRPDRLRGQFLGQPPRRSSGLASSTAPASPPTSARPTSSSAARSGCSGIREIIEKYDPPAVFVYQTCVPAMIGDDIDTVCKAAAREVRQAGHPDQCAWLRRAKNLGNKLAGEALLDHVIGTAGAGIHHALRHQHHRRIQRRRRAVAGEAAAGRAWHPHPRLHLAATRSTARWPARTAPGRR